MTKMKYFLSSTLLLLALLLPMNVAAYDFEVDGIYYNINGDEATVTYEEIFYDHGAVPHYYSDYSGDVVIPSSVSHDGKTYPVTAIGNYAFDYCGSLTSVTIPNSVTAIGHMAFYSCYELTSVVIGNSVTAIGSCAFQECSRLTSVNIPNSVKTIGFGAFESCINLTSVTLGNAVTSIGRSAFYGCNNLSDINFPKSLTNLSSDTFARTAWYDNQPDGLVYAGLVAYQYKGEMPVGTSITLDDCTVAIADGAFSGCAGLSDIFIPNTVIGIGSWAFGRCTNLTNIVIPNSVTTIGEGAFNGCI